jgi:hypothetical protein
MLRIFTAAVLALVVAHTTGDVMEGLHDNTAEHRGRWSERIVETQENGSESGTGDGRNQWSGSGVARAAFADILIPRNARPLRDCPHKCVPEKQKMNKHRPFSCGSQES